MGERTVVIGRGMPWLAWVGPRRWEEWLDVRHELGRGLGGASLEWLMERMEQILEKEDSRFLPGAVWQVWVSLPRWGSDGMRSETAAQALGLPLPSPCFGVQEHIRETSEWLVAGRGLVSGASSCPVCPLASASPPTVINKYKRRRFQKTKNLLTGETEADPEMIKVNGSGAVGPRGSVWALHRPAASPHGCPSDATTEPLRRLGQAASPLRASVSALETRRGSRAASQVGAGFRRGCSSRHPGSRYLDGLSRFARPCREGPVTIPVFRQGDLPQLSQPGRGRARIHAQAARPRVGS